MNRIRSSGCMRWHANPAIDELASWRGDCRFPESSMEALHLMESLAMYDMVWLAPLLSSTSLPCKWHHHAWGYHHHHVSYEISHSKLRQAVLWMFQELSAWHAGSFLYTECSGLIECLWWSCKPFLAYANVHGDLWLLAVHTAVVKQWPSPNPICD